MPDPEAIPAPKLDPNADYPTVGTCEDGHDISLTFTGAELDRLNAGEIVESFKISTKRDGYIYGRCEQAENGRACHKTLRLQYPQIDAPANVSGEKVCTICNRPHERDRVVNIAARIASGRSASSWCWCGEKLDGVLAQLVCLRCNAAFDWKPEAVPSIVEHRC